MTQRRGCFPTQRHTLYCRTIKLTGDAAFFNNWSWAPQITLLSYRVSPFVTPALRMLLNNPVYLFPYHVLVAIWVMLGSPVIWGFSSRPLIPILQVLMLVLSINACPGNGNYVMTIAKEYKMSLIARLNFREVKIKRKKNMCCQNDDKY